MIEGSRLKHHSDIDFHGILDEYIGDGDNVKTNKIREHEETETD